MSESKKRDTGVQALGCAAILLAFGPLWLYGGWVTKTLWNWFLVPYFDMRPLSLTLALALGLVVTRFLSPPKLDDEKDSWKQFGRLVGMGIASPTISLAFGWILHRWWL